MKTKMTTTKIFSTRDGVMRRNGTFRVPIPAHGRLCSGRSLTHQRHRECVDRNPAGHAPGYGFPRAGSDAAQRAGVNEPYI